jgi:cytochrome c oxidase subunit 1
VDLPPADSVVYRLLPMLTNGAKLYSQKLATFHFWAHLTGGIGMGAFMGMAGLRGMLRRTIYYDGEFLPYMILAALSGALLLAALIAFFYNIVMTVRLKGVLGIFQRSKLDVDKLLPDAAEAAPPEAAASIPG